MLGQTLKRLRKQSDMTQKEVAKILGVRQNAYSQYETGDREPNLRILSDLAKIYNVSPNVFFTYELQKELGDELSLEELSRALQIRLYECGHLFFLIKEREYEYKLNVGIPKKRNITKDEYIGYLDVLKSLYIDIEKIKLLLADKLEPITYEEFLKSNGLSYSIEDLEVTFRKN